MPSPPTLNDEQEAGVELALDDVKTSVLLLGGPGSGKTHTLVHRGARLLARGVPSEHILLLTFTRAAAASMEARIRALAPHHAITCGTFHSVAHVQLQRSLPAYHIVDELEKELLVTRAVEQALYDLDEANGAPYATSTEQIDGLVRGMKEVFLGLEGARKPPPSDLQQRVLARYEALKRAENGLDFHDLLLRWRDAIRHQESNAPFPYRYVLVDEVQDLNLLQLEILQACHARGAQIVAIGDDAQAIYGFRGSQVEHAVLRFTERFAPARQHVLCRNYRNPPAVIELAEQLIAQNRQRVHRTTRPMQQPPADSAGAAPPLVGMPDEDADGEEADIIAARVRAHEGRSQFVLCRTRRNMDALEAGLHARGIACVRRMDVTKSEHARVCCALLTVAACPAARTQWEYLGKMAAPDTLCLLTPAPQDDDLPPPWDALADTIQRCARADTVVDALSCAMAHPALPGAGPRTEDDDGALRVMRGLAQGYGQRLLDFVNEVVQESSPATREARVEIMTAHQSKGLEAEVVHVAGLHEYPLRGSPREEEVRVLFTACTRASRALSLTWEAGKRRCTLLPPQVVLPAGASACSTATVEPAAKRPRPDDGGS